MKLQLNTFSSGTYNSHYGYAVIQSDVASLDIYSPESIDNWNRQVLPDIQKNFQSDLCQIRKFCCEDQGYPVALEMVLKKSDKKSMKTIEKQLQDCIDSFNQEHDYKAKLRFRPNRDDMDLSTPTNRSYSRKAV
ncbi:hypothetical protein [Legionella sp. W05-934-2]|jgi:hypothetical protein|uniref:hypothetical protein n=1 Tax=Legionella sp. W05-934-2 TaxID=1198649 RepID=UPI00346314CF